MSVDNRISTTPQPVVYSSGFTEESFLQKDFVVTKFINECAKRIAKLANEDLHETLKSVEVSDDEKQMTDDDDVDLSQFQSEHLSASNLKQLHNDLKLCYENLKDELINSFEKNYPDFLQLNETLTDGTERNLKNINDTLANIHKKYQIVYQQILRLLQRIHEKSMTKSKCRNKINTLKQISFVPTTLTNIKESLQSLHSDFDPFIESKDINKSKHKAILQFQKEFRSEISNSVERKQYRLLQISCRLERIAILFAKLTAIFEEDELNQHSMIKSKKNEYLLFRNKFFVELKSIFLKSIKCKSLLSLRSNLRCYNFLNVESPEKIVREHFISGAIYACLPISIFRSNNSHNNENTHNQVIHDAFDKLFDVLVEKWSILFNREVMINNDFIANAVWTQLIDTLLNDDYSEYFISRGLPDLFHCHYCETMIFFRKIQKLYFENMICDRKQVKCDEYLYNHPSSIRFRKKCNLSQYFLFRMPYITENVMSSVSNKSRSISYHFKVYLAYYDKMRNGGNSNIKNKDNKPNLFESQVNEYTQTLNELNKSLIKPQNHLKSKLSVKHYEYNYRMKLFQICILNLLKCWDSQNVFIWELSVDFLKLSSQILSFMNNFLNTQMQANNNKLSAKLLITLHSDLYHFCNWIQFELIPLIQHNCTNSIGNNDKKK